MARSMLSRGTEAFLAASTATRNRALLSGFGSPTFAATMISFTILLINAPRLLELAIRPACFHCAPIAGSISHETRLVIAYSLWAYSPDAEAQKRRNLALRRQAARL